MIEEKAVEDRPSSIDGSADGDLYCVRSSDTVAAKFKHVCNFTGEGALH